MTAQDKIFMRDGTSYKGSILSLGNEFVFFRLSDTSKTNYKIPKSDILMIEKQDGRVFIYKNKTAKQDSVIAPQSFPLNYFGMQPFGLMLGRGTFCYERLNKKGNIGVMIPLTLTFDPVGVIFTPNDSSGFTRNYGVNFIGGADVNFYMNKEGVKGFFLGPRVRYGVDMLIDNTEAYSIQTQFGWCGKLAVGGLYQHLSIGIGFARVLASPAGTRINPKQSYGWGSVNYRISFGK
ncbi:MAG: hypothetical protein K0S32_3095 [Bacteroidetes bacterium]|nr:hypothetical protein [Bacteroidota bacterium]